MSTVQIPKWNIRADYVETCNCDYGCPCNFNGFPSYEFCRALVLTTSKVEAIAASNWMAEKAAFLLPTSLMSRSRALKTP